MARWIANLLGVCSILAVCAIAWAAIEFAWLEHTNRKAATMGIQDVFAESRDITIATLRPCNPGPCGLIPGMDATIGSIGATVTTMQQQVTQTGKLVTATAQDLATVGDSVKQVAGSLTKTADAGTGLVTQATADLQSAQPSITDLQPLITGATGAENSFNDLLKANASNITLAVADLRGIADSSNGVMYDFREDTDKFTRDYLTPQPWWKK